MWCNLTNPALLGCLNTSGSGVSLPWSHRYLINEGAGSTILDSVGGANGVVEGSAAWVGTLLDFTNGAQYTNIPAAGSPTDYGISVWVNSPSSGHGVIETGNSDCFIFTSLSGNIVSVAGSESISATDTTSNNAWHNIVQSVNGSGHHLYVDGTLVASGAQTTVTSSAITYLGYVDWPGVFTGNFAAYMRDFCIYSRALTATEAAAVYAAG